MSETNVLNTAWLAELPNAQHDGTTQQICDFASAFQTENARYLAKVEPNKAAAPNRVAERIMKRRTAVLHQKAVVSAGKKKRGIRVVGCPFIVK